MRLATKEHLTHTDESRNVKDGSKRETIKLDPIVFQISPIEKGELGIIDLIRGMGQSILSPLCCMWAISVQGPPY